MRRATQKVGPSPVRGPRNWRRAAATQIQRVVHRRATSSKMHVPCMAGCRSLAVRLTRMADEFVVTCPFCGEQVEIYVEPDVRGSSSFRIAKSVAIPGAFRCLIKTKIESSM